MYSVLEQIKQRRLLLGLKQNDMLMRVGMSRQQYQRLESKGNPRLDTLELISKGLNCDLMLIPKEKLTAVMALLNEDGVSENSASPKADKPSVSDDPWQGLLGDDS
jgi:transcriptional regulator with XRE-family HTH domain